MLKIIDNFSKQYVEALAIVFTESNKTWELFCQNIPMFTEINCEKDIELVARRVHKKYKNTISLSKKEYEQWWTEEKYDVMKTLSNYFTSPKKNILARVCITPLFVRNIKECSFLLPTNANKQRFYNIATHEIIHFYYYTELEKSKICIDEDKAWYISELIIEPIIKYLFPDYIYNHNSYDFDPSDRLLADKTVKLFIEKKIDFTEFVRRMMK